MTTATTTQNKDKELADTFADILGPTDRAVDLEARERLITARIGLLLKQPFFGNLATRMKLVNADEWCQTAATDGRNFYYNSRFIMMLSGDKLKNSKTITFQQAVYWKTLNNFINVLASTLLPEVH